MWSAAMRRDIAAGRREPVDHDHHRLLGLEPHQRIVQLLGAGCRAARAVDVHDHGLGLRLGQPLERLDALLVVADQPRDRRPARS